MSSAVPISVRHNGADAFRLDTHPHRDDFSHHRQSFKNTPTSLSNWLNISGSGGSSFDWNMLNNISKLGTSAESDRARSFKAFLAAENNPSARDDFCRDFTCCGLVLQDLHSLLQHYEDVHVVVMESPEVGPQNPKGMAAAAFDPSEMELEPGPSKNQSGMAQSSMQSAFDAHVLRTGPRGSFPSIQTGSRTTSPSRSGTSTPMSQRFPYSGLDSPNSPASSITPALLSAPSTPLSSRPGSPTSGNYSDSTMTISRPASSLTRNKPFKCPTPGCNKQYLQANGLKYHRLHGQCNFASKDPSLEGLTEQEAEEKLRPYACAVGGNCERRYKNMNGLRYHYQHSGAHGSIGLALLASGHHHALPGKSGQSHQKKKQDGQDATNGQQTVAAQQGQWHSQLPPVLQQQQLLWEQNPYAGYAVPQMHDISMDV
ncbi:hypothetical protein DACRYDRAFT_24705 [Dacryopinax primogenitus]|uniref:C2H2-type domain-containing protein n=1 Tax=Dacryopinax primogenitus (strain DJM 731) TaxID=1858805 RepID=M5FSP4_DACPD|nr:uncharacterized protein DACRYDRAFT_24705 [Dacryopinax primogenitus]EJT98239.1 hypothetical protein DACRYDRAFT_24705 [Dacryopinax primogenitus]